MVVSIIIPVHNAAPFLDRTLQSAIGAAERVPGPVEIIAVENGSRDSSPTILRAWADRFPQWVRVVHCQRLGASAARNCGVRHSRGGWLQFLDADDELVPDKIARQLRLGEGADWIVGGYRHHYIDGTTEDNLPHPDLWKGLFYDYRTGHADSNLIRRTALDRVGGWDEGLQTNEDLELWFQLLRAGLTAVIDPEIGSFYHHHAGPRLTADAGGTEQRRIETLVTANQWLKEERTAYWQSNAAYFLGAILRSIRILATYDLAAASRAYHRVFAGDRLHGEYQPYPFVPRYTRLYPYLGFRHLERLRLALAGVIPDKLKRILKS